MYDVCVFDVVFEWFCCVFDVEVELENEEVEE